MNTSEVLNKAADLIEERGWATGNCGMATTGPACLEGAIAAVIGSPVTTKVGMKWSPNDLADGAEFYAYCNDLNDHPAFKAMLVHLDRRINLYVWNDYQTSGEVVVEALRAAAALIELAKETAIDGVTYVAPLAALAVTA